MPAINLHLDEEQLARTNYLAQQLCRTRTAYIREAIQEYNAKVERDLLARKLREASLKCRAENLEVGREMEVAEAELDGE